MTQLVELQNALAEFQAAGIKVYAISYDEVDALADFARHHGITYPLLADRGSKVIEQFGIRNHFVTEEQVPYYGIPFPGTYLVDEQGLVSAKFFQRNLAQRDSAEAVIDSALGRILLGEDEPRAEGGSDDFRITAAYHGGGGTIKAGALRQVVVRFDLVDGVHIYGDPVPEGMVATSIRVSGPPGFHAGAVSAPPTHAIRLPGVEADLPVWDGRVDFTIPVYVDDRIASLMAEAEHSEIEIQIEVAYQGCDVHSCRIPQQETITLRVPIAPHVGNELAGRLAGTVATTMPSRRFLVRQIVRGWVRSPVRGLRYLLGLWLDIRRGVAAAK